MRYYFPLVCIVIILLGCQSADQAPPLKYNVKGQIKLSKVDSQQSQVIFANNIKDDGQLNPFTWNFIYQGAGVGLGDFDNDGLVDIFFAGNQVSDKIYRNLGDWKFEDRTVSSGINDATWSTGVSIVDINSDGLLDIYVCKHSFAPRKFSKKNRLYLNQGDFKFVEAADQFGLGDNGFSIQALFVDIDNDNDLDCYLVNQKMDNYTKILFPDYKASLSDQQDKLYINENGKYVSSSILKGTRDMSFGLNPIAADFDANGFVDIHVSTDYDSPDALFMNYGNSNLKNEVTSRLDHTSFYSMGSDVADVNQDGMLDLFCVDMAYSSHYRSKVNMPSMDVDNFKSIVQKTGTHQYMFNTLQINDAFGGFQDVAQIAGLQSTDWSWAPLFVDFDQDGKKDVIVTNGISKDIRNNDLREYALNALGGVVSPQNFRQLYERLTSFPVANLLYQNKGDFIFEDIGNEAGMSAKGFSTGMAFADMDNDGDLDIVMNNTNALAGLYNNTSTSSNYISVKAIGPKHNKAGYGKTVTLYTKDYTEAYPIQPVRGYMSSSQAIAHFGVGDVVIDSIAIAWDETSQTIVRNPKPNQELSLDYNKRQVTKTVKRGQGQTLFSKVNKSLSNHKENEFDDYKNQVLLPHSISQNGPTIAVGDFNDDGLDDIFLGSSIGNPSRIIEQLKGGDFRQVDINGSKSKEDGQAKFIEIGNSSRLYICHGSGQYKKNNQNHGVSQLVSNGVEYSLKPLPITKDDYFTMIADSMSIWCFGGADATTYPAKSVARYYKGSSLDNMELTQTLSLAMVKDATQADMDGDGDLDIIVVGEWMPLTILYNEDGEYTLSEVDDAEHSSTGWWNSVDVADFDNDGKLDIIAGNLGTNNKYKPSIDKPFYIFSKDFDSDGTNDVVLAKVDNSKIVPVRGKECSSQEVNFINDKFKDFESFAVASLQDIYGAESLKSSSSDTIYSFSSRVFIQGNDKFTSIRLPNSAQLGPIKDLLLDDVNEDGHMDVIFVGNQYGVEVETVRYDASRGGVLLGKGDGSFDFMNSADSGLSFGGDFRDLDTIRISGKKHLLASQNNGELMLYTYPE